jgi:hypothetical protein
MLDFFSCCEVDNLFSSTGVLVWGQKIQPKSILIYCLRFNCVLGVKLWLDMLSNLFNNNICVIVFHSDLHIPTMHNGKRTTRDDSRANSMSCHVGEGEPMVKEKSGAASNDEKTSASVMEDMEQLPRHGNSLVTYGVDDVPSWPLCILLGFQVS